MATSPPNITTTSPDAAPSSLRSLGLRPQLMTGILLQIIRQHFADAQNIEAPSLTDFVWIPGETSPITIEPAGVWRPTDVEEMPRIIVKRGDWISERIGINDQLMGGDIWDGSETFSKTMNGTHVITMTQPSEDAADILAYEVYAELSRYGPLIRRNLCLKRFSVNGIAAPVVHEQAREITSTSVHVSYSGSEDWVIQSAAPALKTFDFRLGN
jgi:hypothetical protein